MMNLIKGVMFKFDGNKELIYAMWEAYVSVFWCRKHKFETNKENFSASRIIQASSPNMIDQ